LKKQLKKINKILKKNFPANLKKYEQQEEILKKKEIKKPPQFVK